MMHFDGMCSIQIALKFIMPKLSEGWGRLMIGIVTVNKQQIL